jgi:methyl-accepting chemotaxis protein
MKKRRLIAPTVISLVFCGLLSDYVYFRGSPWSVVGLIGKVLSILMGIFTPAFDPALYTWVGDIAVPASIIAVVFVLLIVAISRAKSDMRGVTPDPEVTQPLPVGTDYTDHFTEMPSQALDARAASAFPRIGFQGKMTLCFAVIGFGFGTVVCIIAQSFIARALEREMKSQAEVMMFALSEITARDLAARKIQDLAGEIARQGLSDWIGYIYVEDANGQIVAHEPKDLPVYLSRDFPRSGELAMRGVYKQYRGLAIYEIARRIGSGNRGFVHLGLWRNQIETESIRAAIRIGTATLIALVAMTAVFVLIARHLNRPLLVLVDRAERISKGDLALPLETTGADEIGEIARSLERMRSSLRAVTSRLEQGN